MLLYLNTINTAGYFVQHDFCSCKNDALGIPELTLVILLHFCSRKMIFFFTKTVLKYNILYYIKYNVLYFTKTVKGICHILFTHSSVKRYLGCLQN